MTARVEAVLDKEKASVVEIVVEAAAFRAGYSIYLPGAGGWGGERGPAGQRMELSPTRESSFETRPDQALLYRLTGDRHPVYIDQAAAEAMDLERPILHGLGTLGIAARQLVESVDAHPGGSFVDLGQAFEAGLSGRHDHGPSRRPRPVRCSGEGQRGVGGWNGEIFLPVGAIWFQPIGRRRKERRGFPPFAWSKLRLTHRVELVDEIRQNDD